LLIRIALRPDAGFVAVDWSRMSEQVSEVHLTQIEVDLDDREPDDDGGRASPASRAHGTYPHDPALPSTATCLGPPLRFTTATWQRSAAIDTVAKVRSDIVRRLQSADRNGGQVAEAVMLVCDECGRPDASTITIRTPTGNYVKDLCDTHLKALLANTRAPRRGRPPAANSAKSRERSAARAGAVGLRRRPPGSGPCESPLGGMSGPPPDRCGTATSIALLQGASWGGGSSTMIVGLDATHEASRSVPCSSVS
jgi:hypothetical protein